MNLKAAAHRLDVHYQTAYKWVRSGELTAVRIGGRYDVSEAAIVQLRSGRRAVLADVMPSVPTFEDDTTQEDVLEALEAMATDPVLTRASAAAFAARRGAASLGDACIVTLVADGDRRVEHRFIEHPEAGRAAFLNAMAGSFVDAFATQPTFDAISAARAYRTGRAVRISHVPQDVLRAGTPPQLHQHLGQYSIRSLLAAPIIASGEPLGTVSFTRDTSDRPYTAQDEAFAVQLGASIGRLVLTADEIALAWHIKTEVVNSIQGFLTRRAMAGPLTPEELEARFREYPLPNALSVRVLSPELRFLATNETFLRELGHSQHSYIGLHVGELIPREDRDAELASYERLISGELDHLFQRGRRVRTDGRELLYASHRAAVRHPDATLACLVAVARPFRLTNSDPTQVGLT